MELVVNNTSLRLLQGDITKQSADIICNAANSSLSGGGGVDGAIHKMGGPGIMQELKQKYKTCPPGEVVVTQAGNLNAGYVFHAVGPIYRNGKSGEPVLLASVYKNCLKMADKYKAKNIAFPSISTGAYGYPIEAASQIALKTIIQYISGNTKLEVVLLVLFSQSDIEVYEKSLQILLKTFKLK